MPQFNADINAKDPNSFLNYSRGIDVNTQGDGSLGRLLTNVGDIIGTTTKTVESLFETRARDEFVDELNNKPREEYGVNAATSMNANPDVKQVPAEIQRAGEQLKNMNKAVAQGDLSESHYQARVNSIAKQIRARYPGQREYIDSMVSSINGTDPANALRKALLNDAETAAAKADAAANRYETFLNTHMKDMEPTVAAMARAGQISKEAVYAHVQRNVYEKEQIALQKSAIDLKAARNEDVSRDVTSVGTQLSQDIANKYVYGSLTIFGPDSKTQMENLAKIGQKGLSPQEVDAVTSLLNESKRAAHQRLAEEATKSGLKFSSKDMDQMRKNIDDTFQTQIQAFSSGNIDAYTRDRRLYDAKMDNEKLKFIEPEFRRRLAAATTILGPNGLQSLSQNAKFVESSQRTMADYMLAGIVSGKVKTTAQVGQEAQDLSKHNDDIKPVAQATIDGAVKIMLDPKSTPEAIKNTAQVFYGPENYDLKTMEPQLLKGQGATKIADIFQKFSNPMVTRRMLEVKNQGDNDTWENYSRWVERNTVTYGIKPLNDASAILQNKGGQFTLTIDPASGDLRPVDLTVSGGVKRNLSWSNERDMAQEAARQANIFRRSYVSIREAAGEKADVANAKFYVMGGIDPVALGLPAPSQSTNGQGAKQPQGRMNLGLKPEDMGDIPLADVTGMSGSEDADLQAKALAEEQNAGIDPKTITDPSARDAYLKKVEAFNNAPPEIQKWLRSLDQTALYDILRQLKNPEAPK